jgi:hypothetical protein
MTDPMRTVRLGSMQLNPDDTITACEPSTELRLLVTNTSPHVGVSVPTWCSSAMLLAQEGGNSLSSRKIWT